MRFPKHLTVLSIGLVGLLTVPAFGSTQHSGRAHTNAGGATNTVSGPVGSPAGLVNSLPAAHGGPGSRPDRSRHDALDPKTAIKSRRFGTGLTPTLPSKRPL